MVESDRERRGVEQWFRRRGLPAVVRGRSRQVVVRTLPAVVWLALSGVLGDLLGFLDGDAEFGSRLSDLGFVLLYSATLLGSIAVPAAGGWLAARVTRQWVLRGGGFLPVLLLTACYVLAWPVIGDGFDDPASLLLGVANNLVLVAVLFVLTATGVGSIFGWALRATLRQMRGIGAMTSRALPLLLLVTTFGFFTTEIWQTAGIVPPAQMWLIIGFFGAVGALFLSSVLSAELQAITVLSESPRPAGLPAGQPFHRLTSGTSGPIEPGPALTRLERVNVILMLVLTQVLQAFVFGILVFVLFAVLGWLAVPGKTMTAWTNRAPTPGTLFGIQIPMTNELLQVCMFIAGFSALYFIITVVTDTAHRRTFFDPVLEHLKVSLAARSVYLARFTPQPSLSPTGKRRASQ